MCRNEYEQHGAQRKRCVGNEWVLSVVVATLGALAIVVPLLKTYGRKASEGARVCD